MLEFDAELWKQRAWSRLKRVSKRDSKEKRDVAERQWYRDVIHIDKMKTVVDWCASKNLEVKFGKKPGAQYDASSRTIILAGRTAPEKQLYYLLHECGHHLIGNEELHERFGLGYPFVEDPIVNTTFHHRVACLEEEIEAWHRGWRLSKRLRLKLDRDEFDKVRIACLRTYIRWANGRTLLKST
jgi:hypothetical protein